jgi:hypothetical protein
VLSEKAAPLLLSLGVAAAVALIARDLVTEPWQLIDLFTYHYKSYKTDYYFPQDAEWRVGLSIAGFGAAALIAAGALLDAFGVDGRRPWIARLVVGEGRNPWFIGLTALAAVLWALFAVQVHFNRASPHWSQRWLIGTYHQLKQGDEPLIAYQMDWKGETFYSKNLDVQIKKSAADLKKACERAGREFIVVHTDRYSSLKTALGKDFEANIEIVDRSNVKWYLVLVK